MKALGPDKNFLGLEEEALYQFDTAKYVIQPVPYEYTSSYLAGSAKGPEAIIQASQFVEFYDEELDQETIRKAGIATIEALDFTGLVDQAAVDHIEQATSAPLRQQKFVVSFGAEHTVSYGLIKAHLQKHPNLSVLQIDAHSDLRESYHGNIYSHASVMARVKDLGVVLCQAGIRAQCVEESIEIKSNPKIFTQYAHQIRKNPNWVEELVSNLSDEVYISIDADGFDPSIMPAVGTAEPNGLFWNETLELLRETCRQKKVTGFDIVECAPMEGSILSEYTLAKLAYRIIGYIEQYSK